jgi:LacI family transcriptional regulator
VASPTTRPTLHDVAELVGVSARTVSRVVNGEAPVSPGTRARIEAAIDELGYRPNLLARGLINQRSGMIALLVTSMANPFFPEFSDGVQAAASDAGMTLVLTNSRDDADMQRRILRELESHAVEGIIAFTAADGDDSLIEAARRGVPMIVVNDRLDDPAVKSVRADLAHGAELAVGHLLARGCEHPAMIAGALRVDHPHWRRDGFQAAAATAGHPDAPVIVDDATVDGGAAAARALLDAHPETDGVFAYNDLMALGAIRAFTAAGRSVPDQIAVVGFDDIAMGSLVDPALTTIRMDRHRLGRLAVETLRAVIAADGPVADPEPLDVELVIRESA